MGAHAQALAAVIAEMTAQVAALQRQLEADLSSTRALDGTRRAAGNTHHQSLRALGNRLVAILHGRLATRTPYSEHTAWGHRTHLTPAA